MKKLITGLLMSACLTSSAMTFADGRDHHSHRGGPDLRSTGIMFRALDLTDEQREQIRTITQAARTDDTSKRDSRSTEGNNNLNPNSGTYYDDVTALAEQQAENTKQRILQAADIKAQIYAILSYEQQEQLKELDSRRAERHSHHPDTEEDQ